MSNSLPATTQAFEVRESFSLDSLRLTQRPTPQPGPGEVLVRVRAASLNYRDLLVAKGFYDPKMPLPRVPLSDGAGEIVGLGAGVTRWRGGERVCPLFMPAWTDGELTPAKAASALGGGVDGTLAEYVVLPETGLVAFPAHLSFEEAATLPCAAVTAWNTLFTQGNLQAGESVLIQGTGGASVFALQLARAAGARVLAISSTPEKLDRLRALGADAVLNYREQPDWDRWAFDQTGGVGVDKVVEAGGSGTLDRSLRAVRMGGYVGLFGVLTGFGGEVSTVTLLAKGIRLQGIYVGSAEMFTAMNGFLTEHRLRPVIDRVFPLAQAADAFRHLESGRHVGKVVITL